MKNAYDSPVAVAKEVFDAKPTIKLTARGKKVLAGFALVGTALIAVAGVNMHAENEEQRTPACATVMNWSGNDSLWKVASEANPVDKGPDEILQNMYDINNPDFKDGIHPGDYVGLPEDACQTLADNKKALHPVIPLSEVPEASRPRKER